MRDEAEKRIGHLYPKVKVTPEMVAERPDSAPYKGRELTVVAWLWARTVKSPNPAFAQVDVPLVSTFMLSAKAGKEAYVEPVVTGDSYLFTVKVGKPESADLSDFFYLWLRRALKQVFPNLFDTLAVPVEKMKMELLRVRFDEQVRTEKRKSAGMAIETQVQAGLKPWREVVNPHRDVASGKYQQAEFAADLWQVHVGEGTDEYRNPVEFFRVTATAHGTPVWRFGSDPPLPPCKNRFSSDIG